MERELILSRLLDKFENSKHLSEPNFSKRRVMLRIDKKSLPEYKFEIAEIRDRYNSAAQELEKEGIIYIKWLNDRPIMDTIVLNLLQVDKAYQDSGRNHPVQTADKYAKLIYDTLSDVKTSWIQAWRDETCKSIRQTLRLPAFCKQSFDYAREFLRIFVCYDNLDNSEITTRAFSTICFQNSKRFEYEFQDEFLRAASKYHPELSELYNRDIIGAREKLSLLGIYSNPELHQLSGKINLITRSGVINLDAMYPFGVAIPGSAVADILSFDYKSINKIIFIENLTNYNEYLHTEITATDVVVYHGGFPSPNKRLFLQKIARSVNSEIKMYFWGDIDLGGFQMFYRLRDIFSEISPIHMFADDVIKNAKTGLKRDDAYITRLKSAMEHNEFPIFNSTVREIIKFGVTIEQEVFLKPD